MLENDLNFHVSQLLQNRECVKNLCEDFSIVSGSQQPNARGGDLGAYNWLNKLLRTFSNNPFFLGHFPTFNLGHFPASWFCLGHFPTIYFFLGHFPTKNFGHFPTSHFFYDKFQQRPFRPFSKSRIST